MPAADDICASVSGEMFFIMSVIIFFIEGSFIISIACAISGGPWGALLADAPPAARAGRPPGPAALKPGCILAAISIMRSISSGDMFLNISLAVRAISGVSFWETKRRCDGQSPDKVCMRTATGKSRALMQASAPACRAAS